MKAAQTGDLPSHEWSRDTRATPPRQLRAHPYPRLCGDADAQQRKNIMKVGIVRTTERSAITVSILASVLSNGFLKEDQGAVVDLKSSFRMDVGTVVVVHDNEVYAVPRALGSWVVDRIKCVPRLLSMHIEPGVSWVADQVHRVIRSKQYAFGKKAYIHCGKVGKLRFRKGDELLVGIVASDETLSVAVEYSVMPRELAHALLRAMQGEDFEPQQWSPVSSIDKTPPPCVSPSRPDFSQRSGGELLSLSPFP